MENQETKMLVVMRNEQWIRSVFSEDLNCMVFVTCETFQCVDDVMRGEKPQYFFLTRKSVFEGEIYDEVAVVPKDVERQFLRGTISVRECIHRTLLTFPQESAPESA